jgi:hypothetical protein
VRQTQNGTNDSIFSVSQRFVHVTGVIAGLLFGSATALALPEFLGVSSLPEAVESLQAFAERVRLKPVKAEPRVERTPVEAPAASPTKPAATPVAPKAPDQPVRSMPRVDIPNAAQLAVQMPTAMLAVAADDQWSVQAPIPAPVVPTAAAVAAVPVSEPLPVIPSPPLVPEPPVTSSIPTLTAPEALAPNEFVAAAANRPGDVLVASVAILSPDVSAARPLIELTVELPSAADVPLPKARPHDIPGPSPAERLSLTGAARVKAERCLAQAIYFEARAEPLRGQSAVAQIVLNRVFSPHYPKDVCGVVYQNAHRHLACQFTFACDGKPETIRERGAWLRAQRIAREALDGVVWLPEVAKSTHYHASYVRPRWVREMKTMVRHGVHTFYRPRRWGDGSNEPSWGVASIKKPNN